MPRYFSCNHFLLLQQGTVLVAYSHCINIEEHLQNIYLLLGNLIVISSIVIILCSISGRLCNHFLASRFSDQVINLCCPKAYNIMAKDSIQKDTSANCGESKKSIVRKYPTHDNASRGESSTSTGKYGTRDNDYETALRLQRALDEEYAHHRPTYAATRPHLHPANPSSTSISNDDPPYPKNIQDAVDIVQRFIATVMKTKCHECRSGLMLDFDVEKWFRDWSASRDQKHVLSICAIPCPNDKCRASTCLGCGDRPRVGKFVGKHKIDGLVVDWCCESGRVFAIWALLCRYDQMELELQLLQDSQRKYRFSPPPNLSKYGYDIGYMSSRGLPRGGYGAPVSPILSFKQADSKTDKTTRLLIGLIIELLPLRNEHGKAVPQEMSAMIELSLLQDRAAELLRNDSLQDTTSRARLYFALFEFFERLGKHPSTSHLVYEERFAKKQSSGLLAISLPAVIGSKGKGKLGSAPRLILGDVEQMAASLINCMGNLAKQSQVLIKASQAASKEFHTAEGADLLEIANRVVDLYDSMAADQGRAQNSSGPSKNNFATWEEYHQNHCMVTEDNVLAHLVTKLAIDAKALDESPRNRIKRLVTEISEMSTSLPLNIFVKADTVRPDVMKCLIVGPEGTPYEYGLFE